MYGVAYPPPTPVLTIQALSDPESLPPLATSPFDADEIEVIAGAGRFVFLKPLVPSGPFG